jgi:predicted DNA-binding antitoxin AbrB/MazE fold protein
MLKLASMTTNLKAIYEKGVLRLQEPLPLPEGAEVDVSVNLTESENGKHSQKTEAQSCDALARLLNECGIDTGISDLAQQHDHYLYGLTKNVTDADNTR